MALILIADDEMSLREFLRKALSRLGHEVLTAPRIDQALDLLAKRPVDLVILDAHFPGESGMDLIRGVRTAKNPVPVIVYSGHLSETEESEIRSLGVADIVLKGGQIQPLLDCISKILIQPAGRGESAPSKRAVLVVDDDPSIRRILRRFLEERRFVVSEASSGVEAVEVVRSTQPLAAVFLDVRMPGELDGIGALQKIHRLRPELGVIMVTGEQDDETVQQAIQLGASGYVSKPFDFLYLEMMLVSKIKSEGPSD